MRLARLRLLDEALELARELSHARPALLRFPSESSHEDVVEAAIDAFAHEAGRLDRVAADVIDEDVDAVAGEGGLARRRFVKDRRERVLVARGGGVLHPERLLRRHVADRPCHELRRRERQGHVPVRVGGLREAEVHQNGADATVLVAREEDVRRLDVAMEHASVVRVRERRGDGNQEAEGARNAEDMLVGEEEAEVLAGQDLHDQVRDPLCRPDVEHGGDVRVTQARRDPPLPEEAADHLLVVREVIVEALQRDVLAEARVHGLEDAGGGPPPHAPNDLVWPRSCPLEHLGPERLPQDPSCPPQSLV